MKQKRRKILAVILVLLIIVVLAGCSAEIAGTWKLSGVRIGSEEYSLEKLAKVIGSNATENISVYLIVDDKGKITVSEDEKQTDEKLGTVEQKGDKYLFKIPGQDTVAGTIEDGKLILEGNDDDVYDSLILEKQQ
ncbi:MAG: hypothetical protein Q4C18_06160 [Eubacteriales bacterium]|nr:hypothetical protein [Eubacteriales bacterium]